MKKLGRPKTTGRFKTREELVKKIWSLYLYTNCSESRIARNAEVSPTAVGHILKETKEIGMAMQKEREGLAIRQRGGEA